MDTTFRGYNVAFLLHVVIEMPAAINFMVQPSKQLGKHTPHAHAIVRQYALLLLSSILIAIIFAPRPVNDLTKAVAGSLAIYHIGPALRSWSRLRSQAKRSAPVVWSEAALYLVCHLVTGTALLLCFMDR